MHFSYLEPKSKIPEHANISLLLQICCCLSFCYVSVVIFMFTLLFFLCLYSSIYFLLPLSATGWDFSHQSKDGEPFYGDGCMGLTTKIQKDISDRGVPLHIVIPYFNSNMII